MNNHHTTGARRELSLFIEELCCELCRFEHVLGEGCPPESVRVDREVNVDNAHAFADILVRPPGQPPYFVEVKYGDYSPDVLVRQLGRKYSLDTPAIQQAHKLVLVVDIRQYDDWPDVLDRVRTAIAPHLTLEVWDEKHLGSLLARRFNVNVEKISEENAQEVRTAIDRIRGFHAFGTPGAVTSDVCPLSPDTFQNDTLQNTLLYYFDFWRLKQIREASGVENPRDFVPPGMYPGVVVIADLCSYSSYVHDTPDEETVRNMLTTFYSRSRYPITGHGGMFYQFVGDEVVGFFGVPDGRNGFAQDAIDCARALVDIGNSVSQEWQRHIDRMPESGGVHIGMAAGDLLIISERPFSRTHLAAVGDAMNVASRLMSASGPSEITISNSFYNLLNEREQDLFEEAEPVAARNVGRIKCWRQCPRPHCR